MVAKTKKTTRLTPIKTECVIEPMSVPMLVTHFCAESVIKGHSNIKAADLCHAVRGWWRSDDEAGFSAIYKINRRVDIRNQYIPLN